MTSTILVTGGTGTLGGHVVPRLLDAGHRVRVLSRHDRADADRADADRADADGVEYVATDLLRPEGIDLAVEGADIVLHLAGGPKGDDEATRNLAGAASRAGVRHLVYISVIGADRVPLGWFGTKRDAEQAVRTSGIPWTALRAAQFHDLILLMCRKMARLPVVPVPAGLRFQPVDARDVADRLVQLTLGDPTGQAPDLAGPKVYEMGDLIRTYLQARDTRRLLVPVPLPGKAGRAYRAGDNLSLDGTAVLGERTWEDFLAERLG
ncbi:MULTISPECIES: NAD(P)H-binding protein [unclassified Streptomyces]|uniref:SDR family oxidoreductase n=1 Tax=unclassified Streptomyces TaxID=2593676 RepID=UPI003404D260